MLRVTIGAGTNAIKRLSPTEWVGVNSTFSQIIRWARKPMWLPPAKSKLFRISQRHRPPPEEFGEILRLHNNYKTYMKSIKYYCMKIVNDNKVLFDEEVVRKTEEEDYNRCIELNNKWNNEVKKIRDQRLANEDEEQRIRIIESLAAKKKADAEMMEQIEEKVRVAKELSATFITPENIDQAIEEALTHVVNYNEAIDRYGKPYTGENVLKRDEDRQSVLQ